MASKLRLLAAAAGLVSVTLLTACSSAGSPASSGTASSTPATARVKIGVAFPVIDQFLQTVADGIKAEAAKQGVEVNIVDAQEKSELQLSQIENFVSQQVDGMIVIPVDTDAAGPMTDAAQAAKIPLVYVNRRPAELPAGVPYVGSDSLVSGTLEMTELARLAGGKGNVVILQGDLANESARLRTKACEDVVAGQPAMRVTKKQAGNWSREEGQSIMENWLQSGDEFKVVCSNNDEMALGAINAIKAAGRRLGADGILVGGVDATPDALEAMKAGDLAVTVFQDAAGQARGGLDAVLKLIRGEPVPDYVDIPYRLVTPENLADFA